MTKPKDTKTPVIEKAYKNLDFLTSKDARPLRILSEYLYPKSQLKEQKVEDTIVIFGSARAPSPEDLGGEERLSKNTKLAEYYNATRELSKKLTEWSLNLEGQYQKYVVCSGGGPGIMIAANRGACDAGGKSMALRISLPFENIPNPYVTPELDFEFHYFFTRKFWFTYPAKALVIMPGGFGTMDEFFEILTLIQTKKITKNLPIVLFGKEFWSKLINFETLVEFGTIDRKDLDLFFVTSSVDDAFNHITSRLHPE
tara:strand:+ start:1297 stop:2064 length:768 start_codon:yes stop_codon:yes gene_type:complete